MEVKSSVHRVKVCLSLLPSSTGVIIEEMDSEDSGRDLLLRRKFSKTRFVKKESMTEGNCGIYSPIYL